MILYLLQDRADVIFKQVQESKALKGRSNDAIASACLYIACRQEAVPRTFKGMIIYMTKNQLICIVDIGQKHQRSMVTMSIYHRTSIVFYTCTCFIYCRNLCSIQSFQERYRSSI